MMPKETQLDLDKWLQGSLKCANILLSYPIDIVMVVAAQTLLPTALEAEIKEQYS